MPDGDETDIYSEETREDLVENGEISPSEEGFMQGASDLGQGGKCGYCGKPLEDDFIEKEIDGENCRFCSEECLEKYEEKKEKE